MKSLIFIKGSRKKKSFLKSVFFKVNELCLRKKESFFYTKLKIVTLELGERSGNWLS